MATTDSQTYISRTSLEPERNLGLEDELLSVERNLLGHIERTEDILPRGLNALAVSDREIDQFLEVASVYDEERNVWRLPHGPASASELRTPVRKLVNSVIRFLGWTIKCRGQFSGIRTAVDTHARELLHAGQSLMRSSSPSLVVKGSGPSLRSAFCDPVDYAGVSTCLEVQPESEIGKWTSTDVVCHLGVYAKQIFIQQPNRRFVRCLFITEQHVCLVHFDRGGAQYTPFISIRKDPRTFVRLILAVTTFDERELGFDTSVRWRMEGGVRVAGTIDVLSTEGGHTEYRMLDVSPTVMHYDIRSRGLRIWRAEDDLTGEEVCIKDSWLFEDDTPEYQLLERVKGVQGVVQMRSYDIARTSTRAHRNIPSHFDIQERFSDTCHKKESRIVLEAYGDNIIHCSVEGRAISAFRDVIAGLRNLREIGLYHRDISSGNVLLGKRNAPPGDRGVLIDLDMACEVPPPTTGCRDTSVGTFPYMSIAVLRSNYDHEFCARQYRDHLDDIESVFYLFSEVVFYWDPELAPLWWGSPDLYECAAAKLLMFCVEPDDFDTGDVDPDYGDVSCKLLKRFFAFVQDFVVRKEEINTMGNPEEEERERLALINAWEVHFDGLLAIFDEALEELGLPSDREDGVASPSESPTSTLAERLGNSALTSQSGSKGLRL